MTNQNFSERLREAGLRATRPRLLVLTTLAGMGGHHSVDDLVSELEHRGTPLPRGSVYGVMDALVSRGLVTLADAGPGRALYELHEHPHHHFVCWGCGQVQDVPASWAANLDRPDFDGLIEQAQVIFRGRCRTCLSNQVLQEDGSQAE